MLIKCLQLVEKLGKNILENSRPPWDLKKKSHNELKIHTFNLYNLAQLSSCHERIQQRAYERVLYLVKIAGHRKFIPSIIPDAKTAVSTSQSIHERSLRSLWSVTHGDGGQKALKILIGSRGSESELSYPIERARGAILRRQLRFARVELAREGSACEIHNKRLAPLSIRGTKVLRGGDPRIIEKSLTLSAACSGSRHFNGSIRKGVPRRNGKCFRAGLWVIVL